MKKILFIIDGEDLYCKRISEKFSSKNDAITFLKERKKDQNGGS